MFVHPVYPYWNVLSATYTPDIIVCSTKLVSIHRCDSEEKLECHLRIILPSVDNYGNRLIRLGLNDLSVSLEIQCLRYLEKVKSNPNHPLMSYIPKPVVGQTRKTHSKPKHRTSHHISFTNTAKYFSPPLLLCALNLYEKIIDINVMIFLVIFVFTLLYNMVLFALKSIDQFK